MHGCSDDASARLGVAPLKKLAKQIALIRVFHQIWADNLFCIIKISLLPFANYEDVFLLVLGRS